MTCNIKPKRNRKRCLQEICMPPRQVLSQRIVEIYDRDENNKQRITFGRMYIFRSDDKCTVAVGWRRYPSYLITTFAGGILQDTPNNLTWSS